MSQIWKILLIKGVKSPRQKKFYTDFFYLFNLFKRLVAPSSRSPMSKSLRYSKFLGKSNGKKWSQTWKLLLIKGVKSPRKKIVFFFRRTLPFKQDFFGIGATIRIGQEICCLPYAGFLTQVSAQNFLSLHFDFPK